MSWHLGELGAFDCESTGTDVESDRIVSATVAHVIPGQESQIASHLIAVDVEIPAGATAVHGITTEQARANGKPAAEVLEAVAAHLVELMANGTPVITMNGSFDLTLLDRELRRNNLAPLDSRLGREPGPIVDIYVLDKHLDRYRKGGRKLTDMCATYGVKLDGAHDATADALGAARVAYRMMQRAGLDVHALRDLYGDRPRQAPHIAAAFNEFGRLSLAELHEAQKVWYADQATSLAAYFRQKANEEQYRASQATDEAERELALKDAESLRLAADNVSTAWPVKPWAGA